MFQLYTEYVHTQQAYEHTHTHTHTEREREREKPPTIQKPLSLALESVITLSLTQDQGSCPANVACTPYSISGCYAPYESRLPKVAPEFHISLKRTKACQHDGFGKIDNAQGGGGSGPLDGAPKANHPLWVA